ncbi:MAG: hypothetical protein ABR881_16310 [Candidatus Sulfotelmatobacter sp.]|jgi:hypothetical protein
MLSNEDDYYRYIEYLQQQTLDEDWRPAFDSSEWKAWVAKNRERLEKTAESTAGVDGPSLVAHFERSVQGFTPTTQFELPTTKAIFEPILSDVKQTAAKLGIQPVRPIEIATSTDSCASPASRPTTTDHLLFIGLGTSSFCNYWAKCITAVNRAIAPAMGFRRVESAKDLERVFRQDPSGILLAARLGLYYAVFGTMIGFGEVQQPETYSPYRLQLLHAMEVFAVAHEYAHFVSEERIPQFTGSLDPSQSRQLEFFCDELGLVISRECESARNNYLLFAGVGALVFFRAIQVCESVRELLVNSGLKDVCQKKTSDSHPFPAERIVAIKSQVCTKTAPDQQLEVKQFIDELRHNSGWARFRGGRRRQLCVSSVTVTGPKWSRAT